MADKAVISEYSWRSKEMQQSQYPDMPHFFLPGDISLLLRNTQRKNKDIFHCVSLGILADNEQDFRSFVRQAWKLGASIKTPNCLLQPKTQIGTAVYWWKEARREGAAKAGGYAKARNAEAKFWEGFSRIANRWHLPSRGNTSEDLLAEAETTRNTVVAYLGYTRLEWRKLSDAKRERVLKGKINVKN